MAHCTNKGCNQEYNPEDNAEGSCTYHSGGPIFHEGLKSWSCCQDVNKPVLDFDEFMKIPGCTFGKHTSEAPKAEPPKPSPSTTLRVTETQGGSETYSHSPAPVRAVAAAPSEPAPPIPEEEDDLSAPVKPGVVCRRKGCGKEYVSDEINRLGDGEETICTYHSLPPIFHEGSKGYLCCKRRVLEFDEFLKIEGCKKGRHVFVPKNQHVAAEQFTDCRIDHYQTPTEVHVSVFAKQVDKERSVVTIDEQTIYLDLHLPAAKRFRRSIELYGPIDPVTSSFKFYGTKVELVLKKQDTRSWAVLEKTDRALPVNLTFGVGGRTGTIGAKELILDNQNANKVLA